MEQIFIASITRKGRLVRQFLIKAATIEEARGKFVDLNEKETVEGDEPLIKKNQEISFEPLEWETDVVEI